MGNFEDHNIQGSGDDDSREGEDRVSPVDDIIIVVDITDSGAPEINLSLGSDPGQVRIDSELIQANVSNDDDGGICLLNPIERQVDSVNHLIVNHLIVNNVAAHAGGGLTMEDVTRVAIVNNTIADNVSTYTEDE